MGTIHPITQMTREAVEIFHSLGFEVFLSPEIDDEWNNFDSLNVASDHPSRDIQDTFWLTNRKLLRTHTSNGQVRAARSKKFPLKIVIPGRCFRNEATDSTHETTFTQLEGIYIDKNISVGHLLWTLEFYLKKMFGHKTEIRFRPHFYPFVEPGIDVDIKFNGKWLEILGSGMVHPKVLTNMKIDTSKYSGFAFGMGIDRLVMLKCGIPDIRKFYSGDLRFIKQF